MEVARLIEACWCLIFLCRKLSDADFFVKFSEDDELSGFTCPAELITFKNEHGLSTLQCLLLCVQRENCYGTFLHDTNGQCIGCKEKFPKKFNYPVSDGMLFYRASNEYIVTKYKVVLEAMTWHKAKESCEDSEGQLVSFRSNEEREFIETYILQGYGDGAWLWIGGYDIDRDGTFHWFDGTPVNDIYMNWAGGQPDALDQQCVAFSNSHGVWNSQDGDCEIKMSSICELHL